jgi:hypothetical protein
MDDRMLVYDLMYQAFIDIRYAAHEGKSLKAIFKVANLFHNVPSQIERIEREKGDFSEILTSLKMRSQLSGCESWLNNAILNFRDRHKSSRV